MSDDTLPPPGSALQRATDGWGDTEPAPDPRARHAGLAEQAPGYLLVAVFALVFVAQITRGGIPSWGLSAEALAEGRWHTVIAHMFAHGGVGHLLANSAVLLGLSPVVMLKLGGGAVAWVRYALLFTISGLLGAAAYLALHPTGVVPMVGASGAIFGLWGAAARIGLDGGLVPLRSAQVWAEIKQVAKVNLILLVLFGGLAWLSGGGGGLAWESHLGGFVFGLLAAPWFMRQPEGRAEPA